MIINIYRTEIKLVFLGVLGVVAGGTRVEVVGIINVRQVVVMHTISVAESHGRIHQPITVTSGGLIEPGNRTDRVHSGGIGRRKMKKDGGNGKPKKQQKQGNIKRGGRFGIRFFLRYDKPWCT